MQEIISILLIAIALSMDTFSVSLSLGTTNINLKKGLIMCLLTGIMHFIMPLGGMIIGNYIFKYSLFNPDFFLGIIFLVLASKMIYDIYYEKEEIFNLNYLGIFLFSISVSIDAFTTGIGLLAITNKIILATFIFMIVSFIFTLSGLLLGKYINKKIGKISTIIGILILLIMAIHLII